MNVAVFSDIYFDVAGGIPTSIQSQRADLERLGHTVHIFCPGTRPSKDPAIHVVPTNRLLSIFGVPIAKWPKRVAPFIRTEVQKLNINIIHVHYELSTSISAMKIARELQLPLVQTMHGREDVAIAKNLWPGINTIASWLLCKIHARLIPHKTKIKRDDYLAHSRTTRNMWEIMINHANFADHVIFPSSHFQTKFRHYGLKKPSTIVSNGISDQLIKSLGPIPARQLSPSTPLKIIWFSRMSREKRPLEFLEAIRQSGIPVKLDMYGDGNLENRARRFIARHQMKGIKIHGRVQHSTILKSICTAHVAILNSFGFDNQPMTLLEGIATGLPTIIVDPDMKEVLPKGSFVFVPSPNIPDMAATLRDLSTHPDQISKMSRAALAQKHTALQSHQTKTLLSVYTSLLKK